MGDLVHQHVAAPAGRARRHRARSTPPGSVGDRARPRPAARLVGSRLSVSATPSYSPVSSNGSSIPTSSSTASGAKSSTRSSDARAGGPHLRGQRRRKHARTSRSKSSSDGAETGKRVGGHRRVLLPARHTRRSAARKEAALPCRPDGTLMKLTEPLFGLKSMGDRQRKVARVTEIIVSLPTSFDEALRARASPARRRR